MSRIGAKIGALTIGTLVSGALALAFAGPAMADDHVAAKPAANVQSTHQQTVHSWPSTGHKPPARHDHKPSRPTPRPCKIHCPKPSAHVVARHISIQTSFVKHNGWTYLKKVTSKTTVTRHVMYTVSGHKCVKHTWYSTKHVIIAVKYVLLHKPPVVHRPVVHHKPVTCHKPGDVHSMPVVYHTSKMRMCTPPVVHQPHHKAKCKPHHTKPASHSKHHKCKHGDKKPGHNDKPAPNAPYSNAPTAIQA